MQKQLYTALNTLNKFITMVDNRDNLEDIPYEDKTKWEVKLTPPFVEVKGEHIHCPEGYHYRKGYPIGNSYVHGICVKNPKKKFGFI